MAYYCETADAINILRRSSENWTTGPIVLPLATSSVDDTIVSSDISPTIGHNKRPGKIRNDETCFFLASHLNENTTSFRLHHIIPLVVNACKNAGFKVCGHYRARQLAIRFECAHGQYHNEERNQSTYLARRVKNPSLKLPPTPRRKSRVQKPILPQHLGGDDIKKGAISKTCSCVFMIYWHNELARWFIPRQQSGSLKHSGHIKLDPKLIRIPIRHVLSSSELSLADDSLRSLSDTTSTLDLLAERNNACIEWQAIHNLKEKKKNDLVFSAENDISSQVTPVDRFLAYLRNDPTKSFIALFAEYESGLLTIKTKSWCKSKSQDEDFTSDLGDDTDSPELYAASIRNRLVDSNNGRLLLAVAWTSDESRRKFDMYPESITGDDTESTNNEQRPLFVKCSQDGNNQVYDVMNAFLPSKATWSYAFVYRHAMPYLHPGTGIDRINKIVTDACKQETRAIDGIVGKVCGTKVSEDQRPFHLGSKYAEAEHGHCCWHLKNRNFTNHPDYKALLAGERTQNVQCRIEIDVLNRWLWYIMTYCETQTEVSFMFLCLIFYLSETDQSDHFGQLSE